jgi:hypothetical protein
MMVPGGLFLPHDSKRNEKPAPQVMPFAAIQYLYPAPSHLDVHQKPLPPPKP